MEKKSLFSTKTMVATALGAALFFVLFAYVKIPSPIPETNFQLAYGVSAFFGCLFGPVASCLIAAIGHTLNDFIFYGSPWWSWVVASAVSGLVAGFAYFYTKLDKDYLDNYCYQRNWKCHCMGTCSSMLRYCYLC